MDHRLSIFRALTFDGCIYVKIHSKAEFSAIRVQLIKNGAVAAVKDALGKFVRFKDNAAASYQAVAELTLSDGTVVSIESQEIRIDDAPVASQATLFPAEENLKGGHRFIDSVQHYDLELKVHKGCLHSIESENAAAIPRFLAARSKLTISKISFKAFWQDDDDEENCDRYRIQCALDKHDVLAIALELEQSEKVFYCALVPDQNELRSPKSPFASEHKLGAGRDANVLDATLTTPSFHHLQTYLDDGRGMNIRQLWARGETGSRATVHFLDFGIWPDHENLIGNVTVISQNTGESFDPPHGTGSAGCIAANNVAFGVRGIAHDCDYYAYSSGDFDAVSHNAAVGDIVAINSALVFPEGDLPLISSGVWRDRIRLLSTRGVNVLLAAGNGATNLATSPHMQEANRVDTGSILVGASNRDTGGRYDFSNFGHFTSLLNSWGRHVATTGGAGELQFIGHNRSYTAEFSGTSSALPLCAGAIALIQSAYMGRGFAVDPIQLRQIIARTGFNDVGQGIGRRPNAFRAAQEIGFLPSILDTADDFARLGQDATGAWLAQLLSVHGSVKIVASDGVWTARIVLPPADGLTGRFVDMTSQASWEITVELGHTSVTVRTGDIWHFRVISGAWNSFH